MNLVITAATGDCASAQDAAEYAAARVGATQQRAVDAQKAWDDDRRGSGETDIEVGFAACLLTSGVLGVFTANPVLPAIGGAACIGYFGYQEWRFHQKTEADHEAYTEAMAALNRALDELKRAQAARNKACNLAGGCGSRGGRGFRRPNGRCAGWHDWGYA